MVLLYLFVVLGEKKEEHLVIRIKYFIVRNIGMVLLLVMIYKLNIDIAKGKFEIGDCNP